MIPCAAVNISVKMLNHGLIITYLMVGTL